MHVLKCLMTWHLSATCQCPSVLASEFVTMTCSAIAVCDLLAAEYVTTTTDNSVKTYFGLTGMALDIMVTCFELAG